MQRINITIENAVYFNAKAKQLNVSATLNKLLKNFLEVKESEISVLNQQAEELRKQQEQAHAQLVAIETQITELAEQEKQKEMKRKERMAQFVKIYNPFADVEQTP